MIDPHLVKVYGVKSIFHKKMRIAYTPLFGAKLKKLIKLKNIQIIHDHGIWLPSNNAAASVAKKTRIPYIVQARGMLEPWALSYRQLKKTIAMKLYQRKNLEFANAIIASSAQEYNGIRNAGFRNPVAIIPNGIDIPNRVSTKKKVIP